MSASTIREAIDVSLRYGPIVTTALSVRLRIEKREASLIVDEHADFGSARDIVLISTLVALWQVSRSLTARELTTSTAEFALPEPVYSAKLGISGLRMRFDRPVHRLDVRRPQPRSSVHDGRSGRAQAGARALPAGARLAGPERRIARARARPHLEARRRAFAGSRRSRSALKRSARTLKRQLSAQGVTFSELRERELSERAMVLLGSADLSLARLRYDSATRTSRTSSARSTAGPTARRPSSGARSACATARSARPRRPQRREPRAPLTVIAGRSLRGSAARCASHSAFGAPLAVQAACWASHRAWSAAVRQVRASAAHFVASNVVVRHSAGR